jgi:hypothetical protein
MAIVTPQRPTFLQKIAGFADRFFIIVSSLYVSRIPIIGGAILLLLPAACLWLAPTLLHNLLVLTTWNLLWTTAAAYIFSWSIQVTYRLIAINRRERFELPGPPAATPPGSRERIVLRLLPIPLLISIFCLKGENDQVPGWPFYMLAAAAGFALAYTLSFLAVFLAAVVAPPGQVRAEDFFKLFFRWQYDALRWADRIEPTKIGPPDKGIRRFISQLRRVFSNSFPNGYVDRSGKLYGGHWIAISSCLLSILLYIGLGLARSPDVPALSYLLQLFFLSTWLLAGASFFLDRYRVPLIFPLTLVCFVNALPSFLPVSPPLWFPSSDHYYEIFKAPPIALPPPSQVLNGFLQKNGNKAVVVATAGGGIQAAAWTAEVLTQLQSTIPSQPGKPRFADSIALLSGVSGGAVGIMFFGAAYQGTQNGAFPSDAAALHKIVSDAETPTLNDVAWGLTNPDLGRVLFPFLKFGSLKLDDRGRALENAWVRKIGQVSLSSWTDGVKDAYRPALVFNSTIAETGEPLLFATSDLTYSPSVKIEEKTAHRKTFFAEFLGYDTKVVTAARLAASFPFVTPAARPLKSGAAYHQVDGGYYDNYGLSSLMAWLAEALDQRGDAPKPEILILQIRSFPLDQIPDPTWKTWFYQVYAPFDGLESVRGTGQLLRDKEELKSFEDSRRNKAAFCNVTFGFPGATAPLSWQLNRSQKQAVEDQWNSQAINLDKVRTFLNPAAGSQVCNDEPQ